METMSRTVAKSAFILLVAAAAGGGVAVSIRLFDQAGSAGLTLANTYGGKEKKTYILESTGNGAAIFDYNGDGANDVLIANGTVFTPGAPPTHSQLYRNDGKGHFTEVGQQAGLTRT